MALVRWAPTRELYPTQAEINRLFNTLFFDTATPLTAAPASTRRLVPAMDVVEEDEQFVLRTDLPGLTDRDVKVEILDGVLTISGERRHEQEQSREGYRRIERLSGSFSRSLTLPQGVDAAAVQASFEHGVLEVRVPKPEAARPQAVEITVGGGEQAAVDSGEQAAAAA